MLNGEIPGIDRPVSRLVLGTLWADDPRTWPAIADTFIAGGGDSFDTGFIYGDGRAEQVLGAWLRDQRLREEVVLVGKGGHPPNCRPERLREELAVSLDRLGSDRMDLYLVHRDDASVPAGEFVDALHDLLVSGLVRAYGMSNWSRARLEEAAAWAASHGLRPPAAVSNQLSLARPATAEIWPGAISASGPAWETWLRRTRLPLLAWSSQAEGFLATRPASQRATSGHVLRTWHSPDNLERRRRALQLAAAHGVDGSTVALAWVLRRPHPTFAIFGAESTSEVESALRAADLDLAVAEADWLDLREDGARLPRTEPARPLPQVEQVPRKGEGEVMEEHRPDTYGERWSPVFDDLAPNHPDTEASADRLVTWASSGPVLELGIGTGRVALPIARSGVEVHGIDISPAMLARLAAKPGADAVRTWTADIADFACDRRYSLVYVLASTFLMLLTEEEQRGCLRSVARCLLPDGLFVLEAEVPDLRRFVDDQLVRIQEMRGDLVELLLARHLPARQRIDYQRVRIEASGIRLLPVSYRYASPAELDEIARSAGLRLLERHGGWQGEPFGKESRRHVSVYSAGSREGT